MKNPKSLQLIKLSSLFVAIIAVISWNTLENTNSGLKNNNSEEAIFSPSFNPGFTTLTSSSQSSSITIQGSGSYTFEAANNSGIYVSLLGSSGNGSTSVTLPVTFTVSCTLSGEKSVTLFLKKNGLVEDHAAVVSNQ